MIRNILGSLVALAGAASAVLSPFRDWYEGRTGREYQVEDLFGGITATESGVLVSVLLPFLGAAVLVVLGVLLRSRLVVALAGLVVLGFTILWMVRQGQATGSLTVGGDGVGLGVGAVNALAGGVLMVIGAVLMKGRRRRERRPVEPYEAPPADQVDMWPPTQEPGMSTNTSPWPEPEVDPYTEPDPRDPRTRSYPQVPGRWPGPGDPRDPVHPPGWPPEQ